MKSGYEDDDGTPRPNLPLFFRSEAEAAWLRDAVFGGSGHTYPASSLMDQRKRRIREAAYFKAERRGFAPGHDLDDWIEAEQEVDAASRPLPRR
jgi:hypothetical protein